MREWMSWRISQGLMWQPVGVVFSEVPALACTHTKSRDTKWVRPFCDIICKCANFLAEIELLTMWSRKDVSRTSTYPHILPPALNEPSHNVVSCRLRCLATSHSHLFVVAVMFFVSSRRSRSTALSSLSCDWIAGALLQQTEFSGPSGPLCASQALTNAFSEFKSKTLEVFACTYTCIQTMRTWRTVVLAQDPISTPSACQISTWPPSPRPRPTRRGQSTLPGPRPRLLHPSTGKAFVT